MTKGVKNGTAAAVNVQIVIAMKDVYRITWRPNLSARDVNKLAPSI
jgi:hypothetical protein